MMEKRISVHNPTAMPIYVGSNMVPAGETRDFPESLVPPHLRPQAAPELAAEPESDPVAELLALSVKDIVSGFDALTDEDLARLGALENADDTPRKSLVSAITEEQLKRAAAKNDGGADPVGEDGQNG
jgi:hypothetical protein